MMYKKMHDDKRIRSPLRGQWRFDEPLALHTTWRIGGPADRFYSPVDTDDLCTLLQSLPASEPIFWLGYGSNLLVRDGGIRGTVIATHVLCRLARCDSRIIRVEAGASCAKVAHFAAQQQLQGLEFLAGIPGSMGGALQMNAGAWGSDTWSHVLAVDTVDRHGQVHHRTPDDYRIGYRHVEGYAQEGFIAAYLQLEAGSTAAIQARIRDLLAQRAARQPLGVASGGSVFRNPDGDYAARLIEQTGLKGLRLGGAEVSTKHANFILNADQATALDVEYLIERVQACVAQRHGIRLIPEVHRVGDWPARIGYGLV